MNCETCDRPLGPNEYKLCRRCRQAENPNTRDYEEAVRAEGEKVGIPPAPTADETVRALLAYHIQLERALTERREQINR